MFLNLRLIFSKNLKNGRNILKNPNFRQKKVLKLSHSAENFIAEKPFVLVSHTVFFANKLQEEPLDTLKFF